MDYSSDSSSPAEEGELLENDDIHTHTGVDTHDRESRDATVSSSTNDGNLGEDSTSASHDHQFGSIDARAYQLEMFQESMKQNTILAMDTGSGKTQVAVLRIRAELERDTSNKLVWFLAPRVALCEQQHGVLQRQIPTALIRFLRGDDNIHAWSDQITWDSILLNVRVAVSTPQILLDALDHGFVHMSSLSLIVLDEAHNAVERDPARRLMCEHYHRNEKNGLPVPHILGLTASPVMGSKLEGLEALEETLNSVCRSPSMHRSELLSFVNRPRLSHVSYEQDEAGTTDSIRSLRGLYFGLDILEDPYILHLKAQGTERSRRKLRKTLQDYDTFVQNQTKALCRRSTQILRDLGPWAADQYVCRVISDFDEAMKSREPWLDYWKDEEKHVLSNLLAQVETQLPSDASLNRDTMTRKVFVLLEQLLSGSEDTFGIVFVRERTTAVLLAQIIASYPPTRERYPQTGVMVGTSKFPSRKRDIWDLAKIEDIKSLENFRSGHSNLLIATSVLEEGIDVPACNLVVCFDKPDNLKAFIQRRGRARQQDSRLVILLDDSQPPPTNWGHLEAEMKRRYEDQMRMLVKIEAFEESESAPSESYVVSNTGARLNYDNAKQHLENFCAVLTPSEYVDSRPDYITQQVDNGNPPSLKTTVLLPSYVPNAVRRAISKGLWKSERNSTKDAAFQAYVALHRQGLVNDNLLPLTARDFAPVAEQRPALVQVNGLLNIWVNVAQAWVSNIEHHWSTMVDLRDTEGNSKGSYDMVMPVCLPNLPPLTLYLSRNEVWTVHFGPTVAIGHRPSADHTQALLGLNFRHRWPCEHRQQVVTLVSRDRHLSPDQIGSRTFDATSMGQSDLPFLVRDKSNCPYLYDHFLLGKPLKEQVQRPFRALNDVPGFDDAPEGVPYLALRKWTRRADFLHPLSGDATKESPSSKPYERVYPAAWATVDDVPHSYAQFGALVPSILHHIEVRLIASELSSSLLDRLGITDLSLIVDALSARSAREPQNYERLEFLGDSILKVCATINVTALEPTWPEGYLSCRKDRLVSNSRLCRAAIGHGLDKFILKKPFTGHKWRPLYVDDLLKYMPGNEPREMPTKTLADVVEALIGASYVDGGLPKALYCISLFLKDIKWKSPAQAQLALYDIAPPDIHLPPTLAPLEELIGYKFNKKILLVEATTHASFNTAEESGCLERLEFLGDAVLDNIVVTRLFPHEGLTQSDLHLLKTASVNGDFLGFLALENSIEQEQFVIAENGVYDADTGSSASSYPPPRGTELADADADLTMQQAASDPESSCDAQKKKDPELRRTTFRLPLWKFMRHWSTGISKEQAATEARHTALREPIIKALQRGQTYPWALLARLRVKKFYSDLVEAILGAVWVDSGDMETCVGVAQRIGILPLLDRLVRDGVHVLHPKEELGRLAGTEKVVYEVEVRDTGDKRRGEAHGRAAGADGGSACGSSVLGLSERNACCKVRLGERCIAEVDGGFNREEIETRAAEVAVMVLKEEGRDIGKRKRANLEKKEKKSEAVAGLGGDMEV